MSKSLPRYRDLPIEPGQPPKTAWGLFGPNDNLGMINLQTPERVLGALVSGDYFQALGVAVPVGRGFLPEEDAAPGARPVAVISHDLWRRRFGADPGVGQMTMMINGGRYAIVGVAPDGFWGTAIGL